MSVEESTSNDLGSAWTEFEQSNFSEARKRFQSVLASTSSDTLKLAAFEGLIRLEMELHRLEEVERLIEEFSESFTSSSLAQEGVSQRENPRLELARANLLFEKGELGDSIEKVSNTLQSLSDSSSKSDDYTRCELLILSSELNRTLERFSDAEDHIREAMSKLDLSELLERCSPFYKEGQHQEKVEPISDEIFERISHLDSRQRIVVNEALLTLMRLFLQSYRELEVDEIATRLIESQSASDTKRAGQRSNQLLEIKLLLQLAEVRACRQDSAKMLEIAEKAQALASELLGDDHPLYLAAVSKVARAHWQAGDLSKARQVFESVLEKATRVLPKGDWTRTEVTECLAELIFDLTGTPDKVLLMLEESLQDKRDVLGMNHTSVSLSLMSKAHVLVVDGSLDEAATLILEARKILEGADPRLQGELFSANIRLAQIEVHKSDFSKAEIYFEQARAFMRIDPVTYEDKKLSLRCSEGYLARAKGDTTSYLNALMDSLEEVERKEGSNKGRAFDIYYEIARLHYEEKRFTEADSYLRRALEQRPDDSRALGLSAEIAYEKGKKEEALEIRKNLVKLYPEHHQSYSYYARLLSAEERNEEALGIVEKAISLSPESFYPQFLKAQILEGLDRNNLAQAEWAKVAAREVSNHDERKMRAYSRMNAGLYLSAIDDFSHLLERDEDSDTLCARAFCYTNVDQDAKALVDYQRAITIAPSNSAYSNRATLLAHQGRYREAIEDINHVLGTSDETAIDYGCRAYCYYSMDEFEKAYADATKSIELDNRYRYGYELRSDCAWQLKKFIQFAKDRFTAMKLPDDDEQTSMQRKET